MSYAVKKAPDRDTAQDWVQTTYMRAIRFQNQFDADKENGGNLGAWLMTILKRVVASHYRDQNRPSTPVMDDTPLEEIDHPPFLDIYNDGVLFSNEELQEAYESLTPMYQDIIRFSWVEERTDEELAKEFGATKRAYVLRRFKAKKQMVEFIQKKREAKNLQ